MPIYFYFAVKMTKDEISEYYDEYDTDYDKTCMMQWIISSIFTVVIIAMSLTLML